MAWYGLTCLAIRYHERTRMKIASPRALRALRSRTFSTHTHARPGSLKVAVQGCCHGELNSIYSHVAKLEAQNGYKVDLLLICGDFEAMRNRHDVEAMAAPQRFKRLGGFHKYAFSA